VGAIASLLGFERLDTAGSFLPSDSLDQLFSLYRVGLVFMVIVPVMLGLAISIVPLQIGARSLAFPRAAALGLWTWLGGCGLLIGAYARNGGPNGGDATGVDLFLAGLGLLVIGLLVAATALVTTIITNRAPGMTLDRTPAFTWSALVSGIALIITLPVVLAVCIFIFADHRYGLRNSTEANGFGGNAIYPWLRFALSQPMSFIYAIPVLGFVAETVPVFARKRNVLRAGVLVGVGILATAALSGVSQVDHTVGSWSSMDGGQRIKDGVPYLFFNVLPILGILTGLKSRTLKVSAPLLFGLGAVAMLTLGVASHILTPLTDLHLFGTVYEEAEFTFVAYSIVLAAMGGVTYWMPKFTGRKLPNVPTMLLALGATGAAALTSVPYLISGFNNQPGLFGAGSAGAAASGWTHEAAPKLLNTLTGLGHGLMVLTVLGFVALADLAHFRGKPAGDDPWDGQTLEWATASPAPAGNFADTPIVSSAEPLADLKPAGKDA
jgi:heme/copper-type cytochrome/quinol oxidase subunit 1